MKLFLKGNARHWNPADIDLTQDARDFAAMTDDERRYTTMLAAQFLAGEISRDATMKQIADGWNQITDKEGRDKQRTAYLASLNIQR